MNKVKTILHSSVLGILTLAYTSPVWAGAPTDPFGTIKNPATGGSFGPKGSLIIFLNNVLRLIFVIAGIYAFIRIILSGLLFINAAGDTKKITQAWDSIWQSLLGLVIIVGSFALAALMGLLLFGDAKAILQPQVFGPVGTQ